MNIQNSTLFKAYARVQRIRTVMTTLLASTFVLAQVVPTYATIDNTANAVGTYNGTTTTFNPPSTQNVPVAVNPTLTITKTTPGPTTALGTDPTHTDAGDTITYTYVVSNTGNMSMNSVQPVDVGPKFSGTAGTGTFASFVFVSATGTGAAGTSNGFGATANLPIGTSATFTATYTLTSQDVYEAAGIAGSNLVTNTAVATGTYGSSNTTYTIPPANKASVQTTILGNPALSILKTPVLNKKPGNVVAGKAELGDTITYTYAVSNIGNVTENNVQVVDTQDVGNGPFTVPVGAGGINGEILTTASATGAAPSTDGTANNGIWSVLGAGATVTFTWTFTVTQHEIDHG